MTEPAVYDHLRPTTDEYEEGIYRVVGTDEQTVTLLRVGAPDDRRINTGEILTVDRDQLSAFETAQNPDGNRPVGESLRAGLDAAVWSVRAFAGNLLSNPVPATVAALVVFFGVAAEQIESVPDSAGSVLIVLGGLGLAYVGSGRMG